MSNIVPFPGAIVRSWADTERGVRAVVNAAGLGDDIAADILKAIRPLHDVLVSGITFDLAGGELTQLPSEALSMLLEEFGNRIFTERLQREFAVLHLTGRI